MSKQIKFNTKYCKTYATVKNLEKAVADISDDSRYIVSIDENGRYYPVFIGESSSHLIFSGFCVTN